MYLRVIYKYACVCQTSTLTHTQKQGGRGGGEGRGGGRTSYLPISDHLAKEAKSDYAIIAEICKLVYSNSFAHSLTVIDNLE